VEYWARRMRVAWGIAALKRASGNARVPGGRSARVRVSVCSSPATSIKSDVWGGRASSVSLEGTTTVHPLHRSGRHSGTGAGAASDVKTTWSTPPHRPACPSGRRCGGTRCDVHDLPRGTTVPLPELALVGAGLVYAGVGGGRRPWGVILVQLVLASAVQDAVALRLVLSRPKRL